MYAGRKVTKVLGALTCHHAHTKILSRNFGQVGFVGLGNMGNYMARNLLKNGHSINVYDINRSAINQLADVSPKVHPCKSLSEVAVKSDVVITMLPNNQIVLDTYLNADNGLLKHTESKKLLIDSSTVSPNVSREIFARTEERGVEFLDAPVSGGVVGARDSTLTFMTGGKPEISEKAEPILLSMGKSIFHCGGSGSGQIAKICNNMLLGISMIGTSEAMNLGITLGMDPKILMDIINVSTGRCWSSEIYNPVPNLVDNVPSSNNYEGGFMTKLMSKDLGLAQSVANETQTPISLGSLANDIFKIMIKHNYGDKDFSSVYEFIKNKK